MSTRAYFGRTLKRLGKRRKSRPLQREFVDVRVVKRCHGERGATMVMAAILIPVLAVFAGLAWGTAMVYGANQEGRRAADMAALATAAAMPMFNLNASCKVTSSNYQPLPGTPDIPVPGVTAPSTTVPSTTVPSTTIPSTTVP